MTLLAAYFIVQIITYKSSEASFKKSDFVFLLFRILLYTSLGPLTERN